MTTDRTLDWEEGYRAGIEECLMRLLLTADTEKVWK